MCIEVNFSVEKLFNVLHLDMETLKESWILRRYILDQYKVKVIKLRADWLFSRRKERLCSYTHKIESKKIVLNCKMIREWRIKWSAKFMQNGFNLTHSIFNLTSMDVNKSDVNPETIAEWINRGVEELVMWYLQKSFPLSLIDWKRKLLYEVLIQYSLCSLISQKYFLFI